MVTNWNEIFDEAGVKVVQDFAAGEMSVTSFRSTCPAARRLTAEAGAQNARHRARKALQRRNISVPTLA